MQSKRTKLLDISRKVKDIVWIRDGCRCVYCGNANALPNAHYIPRSQSGLGIEKNVLTLCELHHREYDQSPKRSEMREFFKEYLKSVYTRWDEAELVYRK